ncbi:PREDICTED: uncharacterized protein LOC108616602 isoform X2 [Drosophila arizonae]|uniref:Uncharacterized protein LOC108616602 isoform X2 n=1 Tax=Drosophila arizonae TaxID=7263 RepID=A0ABM1PJM0_DROAR|nr:PREDICTED: uncharacterized protein LOC108616602 isoform X2 [Drosophila arizonae]
MSSEKTCDGRAGITWLGFQRRQTVSRYPYNFITAVHNKIKVAVMNSKAFNGQRTRANKECECINLFKGYSNKSIQTDNYSKKIKCNDQVGTASSEEKTLKQNILNNKLVRHTKTKRRKIFNNLIKSHIENLLKLLKVREKLLIDRTTYLVSLFELQKERLKAKGYLKEYSKVNKMQERLLNQMREERLYLKRLLNFTGHKELLFSTKTLGKLTSQSTLKSSTTKQELCRTQNRPMFRAFYSKTLPNFQTGSNLCCFDSKGNLFILSKGRKALGLPVNDVRRAVAQLIEFCSPYIKQNLFDQLKRCETKTNLPMLQADLQLKDENVVAKPNEDLELPPKKSFLKEFNAIWKAICDTQEAALEDFTYYTTFLNELFNEDFVERSQSNMLKMKGEDWPLKSVFAARIMAILIDKIIFKTKNLDQVCVCEILKSHLSCILGAIKMLSNDLFEFILSTDYLNFYTRLIMDLTVDIIREYCEFAQEDITQMGCSLKLSKILAALLVRHSSQPRIQNAQFYTIDKFKMENSCENLDKIVINDMYKSDVNWPSYQCKEPELLKLLINELVILHLNEIIQCVFSKRMII